MRMGLLQLIVCLVDDCMHVCRSWVAMLSCHQVELMHAFTTINTWEAGAALLLVGRWGTSVSLGICLLSPTISPGSPPWGCSTNGAM